MAHYGEELVFGAGGGLGFVSFDFEAFGLFFEEDGLFLELGGLVLEEGVGVFEFGFPLF